MMQYRPAARIENVVFPGDIHASECSNLNYGEIVTLCVLIQAAVAVRTPMCFHCRRCLSFPGWSYRLLPTVPHTLQYD